MRPFPLLLAAPFFFILPAQAIELNFNADSGYSATDGRLGSGSLVGQQQTAASKPWRGPSDARANVLRVTPEPGGGQVLKAFPVNDFLLPTYIFDTAPVDLGGAFDGTSSRVAFGFRLRYDEAPQTPVNALLRLQIGDSATPAVTFEFLNDGRLHFNNGTKPNALARTKEGTTLVATQGKWIEVSGVINYATRSYTLSVNGITQSEAQTSNLGFRNAEPPQQTVALSLRDMASGKPGFVPYSIDDITLKITN